MKYITIVSRWMILCLMIYLLSSVIEFLFNNIIIFVNHFYSDIKLIRLLSGPLDFTFLSFSVCAIVIVVLKDTDSGFWKGIQAGLIALILKYVFFSLDVYQETVSVDSIFLIGFLGGFICCVFKSIDFSLFVCNLCFFCLTLELKFEKAVICSFVVFCGVVIAAKMFYRPDESRISLFMRWLTGKLSLPLD